MEQVVYHVLTQLYTMLLLTQATPLRILLLCCSSMVKQFLFFTPVRSAGVTFVNRHKSNQKDFASATAQEGIKMTALRGKSRISLPLRLQLSCAEPIFPSAAAFICKQQRRVGINLRFKNI